MARSNGAAHKQPSVRQLKRAAGIDEPKNAIALLKADHREAEGLFKAFKKAESATDKHSIARQVCEALTLHMLLEEQIFYPAYIEATKDTKLHHEALVEHDGAKKLIAEIEQSVADDPMLDARVNVLSEMIKHHVKEEERFTGMFAKARMARMDLRALGILIEARKQELQRPPSKRPAKTPPAARSAFMGAAALGRAKGAKSRARRTPA